MMSNQKSSKNKRIKSFGIIISILTIINIVLSIIDKILDRKMLLKALDDDEIVRIIEISKKDTKILD